MTDIGAQLGKQYGPLPLGGWILAGAGGIAVAVMIRRRAVNAPPEAAVAEDTLGISGAEGEELDNTVIGAGNLYQQGLYGTGTQDEVEAATTNEEWRTMAVTVLARNGYDGTDANRILSSYLAGGTIVGVDQSMVSAAIRLVGAPPDAIGVQRGDDGMTVAAAPAASTVKAAPKKPATQPHKAKYVVAQTKASYFDAPDGRVAGTETKGSTITTAVKATVGGDRWVGTAGGRWFRENALKKA